LKNSLVELSIQLCKMFNLIGQMSNIFVILLLSLNILHKNFINLIHLFIYLFFFFFRRGKSSNTFSTEMAEVISEEKEDYP